MNHIDNANEKRFYCINYSLLEVVVPGVARDF